jgi:hypothetical protein
MLDDELLKFQHKSLNITFFITSAQTINQEQNAEFSEQVPFGCRYRALER